MSRQTLRRRHRKICVGDLSTVVTLETRAITEPVFGETNFSETFSAPKQTWAMIRTVNGRTIFNGVDTDIAISHEITIRFDSSVTSETWVRLLDGTRLNVIDVQNYEERSEYLVLLCNARGDQEASKA